MNIFDLVATLSLNKDGYDAGLSSAETKASKLGNAVGGAMKTVAGVTVAAVGAAATAAGAITKQAIESYADFEQLLGGTELLFGTASDFVVKQSQNAYKTVQMSQNDYLTQVNGFAVGLKTALGGNEEEAAKLADKIITAEADIVAATGNSREAVENAFNGIMKSNYTMLDNLQLGITPTKEGMQELIDKVNDWNKANGNATKYQMGNLADMQSALVDYVQMQGLAGYAAGEAADTIQGSLASTKAAWQNLLTGMADENADFGALIDGLIESVTSLGKNILPRIEQTIKGVGKLVTSLLPPIMAEVPALINDVLPSLLDAGVNMVNAVLQGLVDNIDLLLDAFINIVMLLNQCILDNFPMILDAVIQIIVALSNGIVENIPVLIPAIVICIEKLVMTLVENAPLLIEAGVQLMVALAMGLLDGLDMLINDIVTALTPFIESVFAMVTEFFNNVITGITEWFESIKAGIEEFFEHPLYYVGYALGAIVGLIVNFYKTVINGLIAFGNAVIENFNYSVIVIVSLVTRFFADLVSKVVELFTVTLPQKWNQFWNNVKRLPDNIKNLFTNLPQEFNTIGHNIVDGLWNGIKAGWDWLTNSVKELVNGLVDGVKDTLGIASPSKVFKAIGGFMADGLGIGWEDAFSDVQKTITDGLDFSAMPIDIVANTETANRSAGNNVINQTINVNREIATADELAQAIRIESRYGLMKGVALG